LGRARLLLWLQQSDAGLLVTVGYAALGEVVWRHFQGDPITGENAYAVAPQFAGQVRQHGPVLIELNTEQPTRELLYYGSSNFNAVFFAH